MMKPIPYLMLLFIICVCLCGRNTQSVSDSPLAQFRDTIVGCFNGADIDTLIAEPIDTTIERGLWNWRIYSKNKTVDTLLLNNCFSVKMIYEGDLGGNGTDEFGVRRETDAGAWDNYCIYTCDKGEWKYLIEPIWTYTDHFYTDLNKGTKVVERAYQSGYVTVRLSDIHDNDFCIVDTLVLIAPLGYYKSRIIQGKLFKDSPIL